MKPFLHTGNIVTIADEEGLCRGRVLANATGLAAARIQLFDSRGRVISCFQENEGRMWIRGRHTRDSNEGRALLAAYALYKL